MISETDQYIAQLEFCLNRWNSMTLHYLVLDLKHVKKRLLFFCHKRQIEDFLGNRAPLPTSGAKCGTLNVETARA